MTPDEAFDRDIPEALREQVMTEMCEASSQGFGRHGNVFIIDEDHLDAINVRVSGIYTLEDREFAFILENGNWNGTALRGWEEAGQQEFKHHTPTQWALVPRGDLVAQAITEGRGPFLIFKWDAILKNKKDVAEIPGKYAYDRHFQPGGKTETYWKGAAAKHQFELVTQEEADRTRARLEAAKGEDRT